MHGIPPQFVIIVVLVAGGAWVYQRFRAGQKSSALAAVAAEHGLHLEAGTAAPDPVWGPPYFVRGRARRVSNRLSRPGGSCVVFSYQYDNGTEERRDIRKATCALVELPFVAPQTTIGRPLPLAGLRRAVGFGDVAIESPTFTSHYRVTSADEGFATTLFDEQLIAWFVGNQHRLREFTFELAGHRLLVIGDERQPNEYPDLLRLVEEILPRLPAVLQSRYPAE